MSDPNKPKEGELTGVENVVPAVTASTAGVDEVQNAVKLQLYVDKLDAQTPELERVCEESVTREKVIPLKKAILENMVKFALTQPFDLESMKVHRIIYDPAKNVIAMCVRVANTDEGRGNTEIGYTVEGRHGPDSAKKTTMEWIWTPDDDFTMAQSGGDVADYKEGKWVDGY